jgi:hypothetical protein
LLIYFSFTQVRARGAYVYDAKIFGKREREREREKEKRERQRERERRVRERGDWKRQEKKYVWGAVPVLKA